MCVFRSPSEFSHSPTYLYSLAFSTIPLSIFSLISSSFSVPVSTTMYFVLSSPNVYFFWISNCLVFLMTFLTASAFSPPSISSSSSVYAPSMCGDKSPYTGTIHGCAELSIIFTIYHFWSLCPCVDIIIPSLIFSHIYKTKSTTRLPYQYLLHYVLSWVCRL